ncbi:MAG: hypothetical protein JO106_18890 [Mycobacterium sp.]|nr:hypothetical protein [Mycobacterium sp.]
MSGAPVALMAYGTDTASTVANTAADAASSGSAYDAIFSALPSLPPVIAGLNIPGVVDVWNNLTGFLPWDYSLGLTLGNAGGLGVEAWAPSNPIFDFVAESTGTTSGDWPGVASLVGVLTAMGGFTNTESYANFYDPTSSTCLICNTLTILGPGNTDLFRWTTEIPLGGLPQFELTAPFASFGPELGNAFDYSPLANDPPATLASLASYPSQLMGSLSGIAPTISADLSAYLTSLTPTITADLSAYLMSLTPTITADLSAPLANLGANVAANLGADLSTLLPMVLTSLIP